MMSVPRWVYDAVEQRLYLECDRERREVPLSPQQHRLVAYMVDRNRSEADRPVLCEREELIAAIWGDEPGHSPQDLAYVVHQLRGRVDGEHGGPELIANERGRGYRLLATSTTEAVGLRPADGASPARRSRRRLLVGAAAAFATVLVGGGVAVFASVNRSPEPILREGSRGQDVVALQRDLAELGYDPVYIDGQYGPLTASAVRALQQDNGLVVDGEVGPETRRAMRTALDSRHAAP